MQERFIKSRWSRTRLKIFSMLPGTIIQLPRSQYFNVHASTYRLNDAFAGEREWQQTVRGPKILVERIK